MSSAFGSCITRCDRCPKNVSDLDFGIRLPPATRYPVAGESRDSRLRSIDSLSPGAVDRLSGDWGLKIPMGVRARGSDGRVEVVPESVHRRLNATRSRALPVDGSLLSDHRFGLSVPRECGICFEIDDAVSFDCKRHYFCSSCTTTYLQGLLDNGTLPTCPAKGCNAEASPQLYQKLLPPRGFEQYLLASLRATKGFHTCPQPGCGAAVYLEEAITRARMQNEQMKKFEPGLSTAVRCPECNKSFCMVCFQSAHPKHTCEDVKRRSRAKGIPDIIQQDFAQGLDVKPCPRCGNGICKSDANDCDHMTCSRCSKEFCWTCFADRQVIYHHGNHYHAKHCRFYAAYDGPVEFLPKKCEECKRLGKACKPPRV